MNARLLTRIALILSYGGIFVSGVLAIAHIIGREVPCGASGGCSAVAADASSRLLLGIDNAYLGLAAYVILSVLAALRLTSPDSFKANLGIAYAISAIGTLFSGYLTYLEIFQIHAICIWCVASAIIITLLLFVQAAEFQKRSTELTPDPAPSRGRLDFGLLLGGMLVTALAMGGTAMSLGQRVKITKAPIQPGKFHQFPLVPQNANIEGRVDAPITIVEFADLQCPVCRSSFPKVLDIMSHSNGKIRVVFRHFPIEQEHPLALPAAAIAEYAGTKGRFFEFVKALYAKELEDIKGPEDLLKVAESVGLDTNDAQKQVTDDKSEAFKRVSRDVQAAGVYGLLATPTFFIFTTGNEDKPDVVLSSEIEDLLKTPPYARVLSNAGP